MARRASLGFFVLFAALFFALQFPSLALAVNAQCVGGWVPSCPCGEIINPKGGCMGGPNKFMCDCQESTNGFTSAGKCFAPGECHALSTSDGKGPDAGLSQLMQALGQIMQALKGGGGGGSGSGSGSGTGTGCTGAFYQTSDVSNSDPCAYYVPGSASTTGDLIGSIFSNTPGSVITGDLVSSLVGSSKPDNAVADSVLASTSNVVAQNLTHGTSAKASQSAFGASPGAVGDIQVISGNRATILASNRDVAGNKQTSGFYGFAIPAGLAPQDIYTKLCAARQWATNFLSFITPAAFFDALCSSHGYAVGPPKLAVPVVVASTTQSVAPPPPEYLGVLRADIWASPPAVSSGSRTSIFWDSHGALSCAITSDDNAFTQSTLSGHASSQALTKNTTFSISCQSATSTVSNQVVVTIQ